MENPLISIIVITYNSSIYVCETLESIKAQTYKNIELIISDDGSSDDTLQVCNAWIYENKERFVRSELLSVQNNTGIPANCNRGVKASNGEWIKLIAGDDVFIEDGIERFVLADKPDSLIIQTNVEIYAETFEKSNLLRKFVENKPSKFFKLDSKSQYNLLKYHYFLNAPGVFIHKKAYEVGLYNENYKKIEDRPFWIKATMNNLKITFLNISTVKYRIHKDSVQDRNGNKYNNLLERHNASIAFKKEYYGKKYNYLHQLYDRWIIETSKSKLLFRLSQRLHFELVRFILIMQK